MSIPDLYYEIKTWFGNMDSVLENIGAIKSARESLANGKQFFYTYHSPKHTKLYNARTLVDLDDGTYLGQDNADYEYGELLSKKNILIELFNGLRYGTVLSSQSKTFNITYKTVQYFEDKIVNIQKNLDYQALLFLYSQREKGAYPLPINIII